MVAYLWFEKVKNHEKTFNQVPRLLKEQVRTLLIEKGLEELII